MCLSYSYLVLESECKCNTYMIVSSYVSCSCLGAPVAQWDKHWPSDLAVRSSSPARSEIFSNVNRVP